MNNGFSEDVTIASRSDHEPQNQRNPLNDVAGVMGSDFGLDVILQ
jgi:hypothetical protein